jgi:Protein of unknown function DUF86
MGQHLVRREKLGLPQSSRDVFDLLARAGWIEAKLAGSLQKMVGFRNLALHDYRELLWLMDELDDLLLPYMIDLSLYAQIDNPALREHIDRVEVVFYQR